MDYVSQETGREVLVKSDHRNIDCFILFVSTLCRSNKKKPVDSGNFMKKKNLTLTLRYASVNIKYCIASILRSAQLKTNKSLIRLA